MRKEQKNIAFIAFGVFALIAAIQFNLSRVEELQLGTGDSAAYVTADTARAEGSDPALALPSTPTDLNSADFASLSNSKVARQTELGKAVKSDQKNKKEVDVLLTDPAMSQKWDLNLTHAAEAWTKHRATGSRSVKVCVIDTGVDEQHPDLKNNLWKNSGETGKDSSGRDKSKNGVDDDQNGYVDDVSGFNFVSNNNNLTDNHGHGTHIAGAIGAEGGNGIGISGMAPQVSLIIAKYYDPNSPANNNLMNTVRAIRYCVITGADIINYSGGGLEPSEKEREAVALARDKGILFVAAAGNEQSNSDIHKYYPADYDLDNIISVTAFDHERNVLPSSNYGIESVDIAAPGKNIYSTLPGGAYGYMTGTSQATAIVSGVAALIRARFADFDAARIVRHITETGDLEPLKLQGKTKNQKRLNAYRALAILDQGVAVSGVVPRNTANIPPSTSQGSAERPTGGATDGINSFGEDLRRILKSQKQQATQ
jgi:thermitase